MLAIRVVGLPPEAAVVRATVTHGSSTYRVEADVATFDGELLAESVPAGPASVLLEATTPTAVLRRTAQADVTVPLTRILVDFGDGMAVADGGVQPDAGARDSGVGADAGSPAADAGVAGDAGPGPDVGPPAHVDSNPIPHVVRGLRASSVESGQLAGLVAATDAAAYPRFIEDATSLLHGAPAAVTVKSVSITLLTGSAVQVSNLQNLWRDAVAVSFARHGGGASIPVASGQPDGDAVTLTVEADRAALAPLRPDLLAGTFDVQVSGPTDRGRGEDEFSADVRVSVVYTAFDR